MLMRNCTLFKNLLWLMLAFVAGNTMAQTVLLEEDFSKCTSAQPDNPSTGVSSMDDCTLTPGWTSVKAYVGEGNMKFGSSSALGSITTPALDLSDPDATYTLSFKACAWSKDKNILKVSVDDQEAVEVTDVPNGPAPYAANLKEFSLEVKGTTASKITISGYQASKARFFLDDIKVTKLVSGETPAPSVKAPSMVAFGSVQAGTTVSEDVTITGANLTDDLTVAIEGEGFSCEFTAIPKDDAALGAELSVEFAPTAEGDYSGTLTISGGGLAEPVVVALTGSAVSLTGDGSKENPYTIEDVMKLQNPNQKYWVKGVIVGFVNGQSISTGSIFDLTSAETVSNSNLLLAAEAGVTDPALCVPVQLPTAIRAALNLSDNPANLGRELLINGDLTAYFGVPGVKEPTEYEFVKVGNDPAVTAPASVSLGLVQVGGTASKDVTVSGSDLTGDLTVAIAGEGFSCETTTIAKDEAAQGAVLNVVFTPTAEGEYTGTLTISGGGLAEAVTVALTGECVTLEGDGSKENPYTVADVMKLQNPNKAYWVKGVIVGFVKNGQSISDGSIFDLSSAETISNSNLLLAAEAGVTDPALCVPVQLPVGDIRTALNLSDNPANLGRELLINGDLTAYFGVPGIKNATEYELVKVGNDPAVTAPASVDFGLAKIGGTASKDVTVSGSDLTDDLTVSIEGNGFSCETTTIAKDGAENAVLNVVFAPTEEGDYAGTLTISGGGLAEAVTIALTGKAVALEGDGSKENPYTVADVMKLQNPKETYWVKGVIVGFVNGGSVSADAVFDLKSVETILQTNLLLAAEAGVTDPALCVPVQLPSKPADIRTALNLSDNPTNLGRELLIYGSLEAYFNVPGIKSPTEYVLGGPVAVENVEAALENGAPVEVYTLGGVKVGDSLNGLAKGIYVVKQGNQVKKVVK